MAAWQEEKWGNLHPVHAILLGFPITLFSSALIADVAYLQTAEMQWSNFSAWLITGALLAGGLVLAWAAIMLLVDWQLKAERKQHLLYVLTLTIMLAFGFVNILKHSMDAWNSVETFGLVLSVLCTLLALLAGAIAYTNVRQGGAK